MSISKRGDGRYLVKYKDKNGVWRQKTFKSLADAEKFNTTDSSSSELSLNEAISVYLDNNKICQSNVKLYRYLVKTIPEDLLSKQVITLTRRDLELLRSSLRNTKTKAITINTYIRYIKTAINWCVEQEFISSNPLIKFKNLPNEPIAHRVGTLDNIVLVYEKLPEWAKWAAKTVINLCLRPGVELCNLTWNNFNWEKQSVTVYMSKTRRTKEVFVSSEYLEEAAYRMVRSSNAKYVCLNSVGKKLSYKTFKTCWSRCCKKLGIAIPPYALRHLAASKLIELGLDVAIVAKQLGHVNATTTMQYYIHAEDNKQKEAASILYNSIKSILK